MHEGRDTVSRRGVLRRGSALAGGTVAASLAGCFGLFGDGGNGDSGNGNGNGDGNGGNSGGGGEDGDDEGTATPEDGDSTQLPPAQYASWLPARDGFDGGVSGTYSWQARAPASLFDSADALGLDPTDRDSPPFPSVDWTDIEYQVAIQNTVALEGNYQDHELTSDFDTLGLAKTDSYRGYDIYEPRDASERAIAYDSSAIVLGNGETAVADVRALANVQAGRGTVIRDADDDFGLLIDALGGGDSVTAGVVGEASGFDNAAVAGQSLVIDGDTTTVRVVMVFDSEGDVDGSGLKSAVSGTAHFEDGDSVSAGTDGRVATVTGDVPTGQITQLSVPLRKS